MRWTKRCFMLKVETYIEIKRDRFTNNFKKKLNGQKEVTNKRIV